ncbi:MAG: hypothetical protein FJ083_15140 [Cyanobacteria bacterium K_Offshore_surface_m2_239]|nr:hypothetical protein [Cyanobacteria bacterium K_Offshore_surface_m2_239]
MAELVVVVAGSGPQALTLCCLLLQKRPQWRRRLRVLDPSGTWLDRWNTQMRRYEIPSSVPVGGVTREEQPRRSRG